MDQWTLQPCRARIRRNPLASSLYIPMVPILTVTGEKGEGKFIALCAALVQDLDFSWFGLP